jgi:hypothetical protein
MTDVESVVSGHIKSGELPGTATQSSSCHLATTPALVTGQTPPILGLAPPGTDETAAWPFAWPPCLAALRPLIWRRRPGLGPRLAVGRLRTIIRQPWQTTRRATGSARSAGIAGRRGSIMLTTNRALVEWPDLFGAPLLASAGLDRLTHRAHVVVITGTSFRTQGPCCFCQAKKYPFDNRKMTHLSRLA